MGNYLSPRWSGEIADCSLPVSFDTYSKCSYNCLYCFSFFQKDNQPGADYRLGKVESVDPKRVIAQISSSLYGKTEHLAIILRDFENFFKNRYTMQWGGLADGFDEYERRNGVSLELLKFFSSVRYPLSISTKATWFTKDPRYMELIKKNADIWHFKVSIITLDLAKAKGVELGVDVPTERLAAIKRLTQLGCHVTLRLRPYIVGVSEDYRNLIIKAHEAGADSVSTEFFCLETRASERLLKRYAQISKFCGFDIYEFYKKHSVGAGYRRLNRELKLPIITDMKNLAHSLNMRFYVSDAHCKEMSDHCCCCGVPPNFKVAKGNFAEALLLAKQRPNKCCYFSDIKDELYKVTEGSRSFGLHPTGFNTGNSKMRALRRDQHLADLIHEIWNRPKSLKSPGKYFNTLEPIGYDDNGDVIYKFKG